MTELEKFYSWLLRQAERADLDTIHSISFTGEQIIKLVEEMDDQLRNPNR